MLLTLDDVRYTTKPDRAEFARLMNRMKAAEPREMSKFQFLEHIAAGKSFIGGAFSDGLQTLRSWQLAALDFDNETEVLGDDGKPLKDADGHVLKRPLRPGEDGYISPFEALERCEHLGLSPMVIYKTLNDSKGNPRFRIVFDFGETTDDAEIAQEVMMTLHDAFPEADKKCKNPNRIYCGTTGAVWAVCEAWFL